MELVANNFVYIPYILYIGQMERNFCFNLEFILGS